jgi:hypothetical protein
MISDGQRDAAALIVLLLGSIVVVVQLWRVFTRSGQRKRYLGLSIATAFATMVAVGYIIPESPAMLAERLKREEQAKADAARKEKDAEAQRLVREKEAQEKERKALESCRSDLKCWGERHLAAASVYCATEIEKLPEYTMEWTDGMLETKFSRYGWADEERGALRYAGDKARFQNGFGAWVNVFYLCDFDPESKSVIRVEANRGRL